MLFSFLTLYTLASVCIFSTLFFIYFQRCWHEEFVFRSKVVFLVIIPFVLMTLMCDSGLILQEKIRS